MKRKYLFPIALVTIFAMLAGCKHKVSTVITVQDSLKSSAVYADKGGTLKWDAPGPILEELSRRLIHRWRSGATVRE